jgi:hypothetical protein
MAKSVKKVKINEFTIPEQNNMVVRSRHTKKQFMKILASNRMTFCSYFNFEPTNN